MAQVDITMRYEGKLRVHCTHGPSGKEILTDAPKDNHGLGESFSPTDLLAVALGTCVLTLMGIFAEKAGVNLEGTTAKVSKEMIDKPVRRISKLTVIIRSPARPNEDAMKRLEQAAKHCPVHQSLHPEIQQDIRFEWGAI